MMLKMFDALLPYFGGKRKLCPVIFKQISNYLPREEWNGKVFVDAFMGSGAVSLYAKAQGFRVIANDIAERGYIAGKSLIENNQIFLKNADILKLYYLKPNNKNFIVKNFSPDVIPRMHADFLDIAFSQARRHLDKYLLLKYIFFIRPYSKFSSPNAFNRPLDEGRFDEIKHTYKKNIVDNLMPPFFILKYEMERINEGIFSNGLKNRVFKKDVFDFVNEVSGDVLYLDPPYAGTLSYETEYSVVDRILGDNTVKSEFSAKDGMKMLDSLLERAAKFPLWIISFGNAGGKNELKNLVAIVSKYRKCEAHEFAYRHCEAMASEEHKQKNREWIVIGY